jgi:protein ImuB
MRFAAALALSPSLNADCVSPTQIAQERDRLIARLRTFTPDIEPADEPGVFWVGLAGLERLYPSSMRWADAIRADLREIGVRATVVIGFTRFGTYAVAQISQGTRIFHDPGDERTAAMNVPLAHLALAPEIRDTLAKLDVTTVSGLMRLPEAGLLERFGVEPYRLHRAVGEPRTALRPSVERLPVQTRRTLDAPETDLSRCLFAFKQMLDPMLATLATRGAALAGLEVRLALDRHGQQVERIRPAAPTLDSVQVLDLIRLRLEASRLSQTPAGTQTAAGIVDIELTADAVPATHEQLRFFGVHPHRDLAAGDRALARLRTELGEQAVVHARLRDGHLPEAQVTWEPVTALTLPRPTLVPQRTLGAWLSGRSYGAFGRTRRRSQRPRHTRATDG